MKRDMVDERPLWPLSSYAAAKNAPNLLADLDLSSEELRVRAYEAQKSGQMQHYVRLPNSSHNPYSPILSGGI
jgi:nucleoporin NUP42